MSFVAEYNHDALISTFDLTCFDNLEKGKKKRVFWIIDKRTIMYIIFKKNPKHWKESQRTTQRKLQMSTEQRRNHMISMHSVSSIFAWTMPIQIMFWT
jgi:hypothetical protein